ncbi:MAG TPA: hypothetical protein VFK13_01500 [Gemmatimonadaceae bacterium]|nr:hypothetical protein [Gemmatimonadaceae bacterium]
MKTRLLLGAAGLCVLAACSDKVVPNFNNPSLPPTGVIQNPSRAAIQQLVNGLIIQTRADFGPAIRDAEIIGRDAYNLDPSDPRWVTELLGVGQDLDPGGFGGNHFVNQYAAVRSANLVLNSVATVDPTAGVISAEEIAATDGFAKTLKALNVLSVIEFHDVNGAPVDVAADPDSLLPILCRDNALNAVASLLDEALTDLQTAGSADFPFTLPDGFTDVGTPADFIGFNRALKAKVEWYLGDPNAVLVELAQSFASTSTPLDFGAYFNYSTDPTDIANPFFLAQGTIRAHPSDTAAFEAGDDRAAKIIVGEARTNTGITSGLEFTIYPTAASPIPIIRNEELILLGAQAKILTNDVPGAADDINFIRNAHGLPDKTLSTADAAMDEALLQKRLSLLLESPDRWVDLRVLDRLDELPLDAPNHRVHVAYPIPRDESNARGGNIACQ